MDTLVMDTILALIGTVIREENASEDLKNALTPEAIESLFEESKHHDVTHIVAEALDRMGLLLEDDLSERYQMERMYAIYRYQRTNYELQQICKIFERARVKFIPLKGSVLREYYPEPWMRTSCDIDVLVQKEDLERATELLVGELKYINRGQASPHDIALVSQSDIHVELHYDTIEEGRAGQANEILSHVWDYAAPVEGAQWHHALSPEIFYFYHVAHMAKHFEYGGCGIRFFLDLWILDQRMSYDRTLCDELLEKSGLLSFANAARDLSDCWFSGRELDQTGLAMQQYVLQNGIYGEMDTRMMIYQSRHSSKLAYIWSRMFWPYDRMKLKYPILQKHKWLTPFMHIRRLFWLLRRDQRKRGMHELSLQSGESKKEAQATLNLMRKLGLQSDGEKPDA